MHAARYGQLMRIGVDLGGVVIDSSGPDTFFGPNYLQVPPVAGAFEALQELQEAGDEVFFVSKCGPKIEAQSRHWLAVHRADRLVPPERWFFVLQRADKGPLARGLELHAFVDDRQDVLAAMPPGVLRLHLGSMTWRDVRAALALQRRRILHGAGGTTVQTARPGTREDSPMSESTPEVNVDADQVVVNTAPDGGGVDNQAEAPAAESSDSSEE